MRKKRLWFRRTLAFTLSVMLVLGSADSSVFATEADTPESAAEIADEAEGFAENAVEETVISESSFEEASEQEMQETQETQETGESEETQETETIEVETDVASDSTDNIDSGVINDVSWVLDKNGKLTVTGSGDYTKGDIITPPWSGRKDIKSAVVELSGISFMGGMFENCTNLESVDLSKLDTSNVYYMSDMFKNCSSLTKVDLSGLNTENVALMSDMFKGCSSLTEVNLEGIDTSSILSMNGMFEDCASLKSIDFSKLGKGKKVGDMNGMFSGCSSLTEVNLNGVDTSDVDTMSYMFSDCSSLTKVDLSGLNTNNLTGMSSMFWRCSSLKEINFSGLDTSKVVNMNSMFYLCEELESLDLSSFKTDNVMNMEQMFWKCGKLKNLKINTSSFKTGNCFNMGGMFGGCMSLTQLDVSGFDTRNVTDMSAMFAGCSSLTQLNVSGFNTANVTDMEEMFFDCSSLTELNLSSFDLSGLKDETSLFAMCDALETIYTPINLSVTIPLESSIDFDSELQDGNWYQGETVITELPKNLDYSIRITKGQASAVKDAYITAAKKKTVYECNDVLNLDDLRVYYCGTDGKVTLVTDYTTNKDSIDMSVTGTKELCITYKDGEKDLVTTVRLTVKDKGSDDDSPYTKDERTDLSTVSGTIANIKPKVYDGSPYEPVVKVTVMENRKKKTLTEGTDYRVIYENTTNAGTSGTVTVKGNGIYKGELSASLTVTPKPIKKVKIVIGGMAVGDKSKPPVYVYDGAKQLTEGTDYNIQYDNNLTIQPTNAAELTVNGQNNYTGSATVKLAVYEGDASQIINPSDVTLNAQKVPYTGKAIKTVEPQVKIGDITLQLNKDYKVQYQNNKDAGTAYVIVTGKGAYKGKVVKSFEITPVTSDLIIKEIPAKTYNGKLQKPSVAVTAGGKKLSKKDYTVAYTQNLHAGIQTAQVAVTGKGNYAGTQGHAAFTIYPQKIAKASVKGVEGALTLVYSKRTLKEGTDYTLQYGAVTKNKIEVTITGTGDFTGTVTKKVSAQSSDKNDKEDDTKEDASKEDDTKEDVSKEDDTKDDEKERAISEKLEAVYKELHLDSLSQIKKIETIYDYVIDHVAYDSESEMRYTLYGALIEGKAVCNGYALLMQRMLTDNDIPAQYIAGIGLSCTGGPARHAWNIVEYNGFYYNIDATWDHTETTKNKRGWFMKSQTDFEDHVRDPQYETESFMASYPMAKRSYGDDGPLSTYENLKYTFNVAGRGTVSTSTAEDKKTAVLIFGRVTCGNTMSFLRSLKEKEFCKDSNIKIIYADVDKNDESTVAEFQKQYGTEDMYFCYDTIGGTIGGPSNSALWQYYYKKYSGVEGLTLPLVVVIDSENAVRFIRQYPVFASQVEECLDRLKE